METATDSIFRRLAGWKRGDYSDDSMVARLLRFYVRCLLGHWMIRDVNACIVPLRLNESQCRILALMLEQAAANRPVRIIILKGRKIGASTMLQALGCDLASHEQNQRCITIAHEWDATQEIFEIARLAAASNPLRPCKVTSDLRWEDSRSVYHCRTAGGTAVGAGGTPSFLHLSEVPKWEKNKRETLYNALNSVPDVPETIIAWEATAKGREEFWSLFDDASDPAHQYARCFVAWFHNPYLRSDTSDDFSPNEEEARMRGLAHADGVELSNEQLQWRRNKIREIGAGTFRQEYPSYPEEAIQGDRGLILPGLRECLFEELPFDASALPVSARIGGIDFGYHDPTVIWSGYYVDQEFWLTSYYRRSEGLATEHLCGIESFRTYHCDPAALSDRVSLQRECERAGKHVQLVPCRCRKAAGDDLVAWQLQQLVRIANEGRLHVYRDIARQLIVECDTYAWNEKTGRPDDRRTEQCGHYDSIDALRYCIIGTIATDMQSTPKRRERSFHRMADWSSV